MGAYFKHIFLKLTLATQAANNVQALFLYQPTGT
jgi:hypothetical protein